MTQDSGSTSAPFDERQVADVERAALVDDDVFGHAAGAIDPRHHHVATEMMFAAQAFGTVVARDVGPKTPKPHK